MARKVIWYIAVAVIIAIGLFFWYSMHTPRGENGLVPGAGKAAPSSVSNEGKGSGAGTNRCPAPQEVRWPPQYFKFKNGEKVDRGEYNGDTHAFQGELDTTDIGFYKDELVQNGWKIYDLHPTKKNDGFWGVKGKEWINLPVAFPGEPGRLLAYLLEYGVSYFDPLQSLLPLSEKAYPVTGVSGQDRNNVTVLYENAAGATNGQLKKEFRAACTTAGGALEDDTRFFGAVPGTQARCAVASTNMAYTLYFISEPGDEQKVNTFWIYEKLSCTSGI